MHELFEGVDDRSILGHLGERGVGDEPAQRSPLWSRTAYDRYLEWAFEIGTTPNGVFGAKLMWGYFGDFASLLRNVPEYSDLPLADLLDALAGPVNVIANPRKGSAAGSLEDLQAMGVHRVTFGPLLQKELAPDLAALVAAWR